MTLSALCYGLGYLAGALAFAWMARRRGFRQPAIWFVMQAALVGGLVGANAAQWAFAGTAGKTVLGGIAGGWIAVWAAKKYVGIQRPTGDLFALAICAGEAVGRWGCYFGGCCYGKACGLPWRVWQHGAWRHPAQVYLSLACAAIVVLLLLVDRRRPADGVVFFTQGMLYCGARFVVEFFRTGTPVAAGLTLAQWACLAGGALFTWCLVAAFATPERKAPPVIGPALKETV